MCCRYMSWTACCSFYTDHVEQSAINLEFRYKVWYMDLIERKIIFRYMEIMGNATSQELEALIGAPEGEVMSFILHRIDDDYDAMDSIMCDGARVCRTTGEVEIAYKPQFVNELAT